jgi:hypothetical protein
MSVIADGKAGELQQTAQPHHRVTNAPALAERNMVKLDRADTVTHD